jgi:hypothetical protein
MVSRTPRHDDLRPVVYPILATTFAAANVINPDPDARSNNQSPVPPETRHRALRHQEACSHKGARTQRTIRFPSL